MGRLRNRINNLDNKSYGRTKIEVATNELTADNLKIFLPKILTIFEKNVEEIDNLIDYVNGVQGILEKTKIIRTEINNKPVENHAFEIKEFLKGYLVGNPIQLSQRNTSAIIDDVTLLNTYMVEQKKAKKDEIMVENIVTYGKSLYMTLPQDKAIENLDKQSPFKTILIDSREGDVIYSSGLDKQKIGCFVVTELPINDPSGYKYLITIWNNTGKKFSIYSNSRIPNFGLDLPINNSTNKANEDIIQPVIIEENFYIPYVPMTEYYFLESRMGIIEIVKDSLDLLNKINANEMDDIEQFVNYILVLINQDIKSEDVKLLKENKILKLKSVNPQMQADAKFLQQALSHGDINTFYERVYTMMMSIVGIPRANDNVTSGGDTGQARLLGEGWTLASQRALTYQNMIADSERENLEVALWICRNTPNCKIDELYPSDIDIKLNIDKSDNMLTKSQTMLNLKTLKLPNSIIAEKAQLFNDPLEVSKVWDKYEEELLNREQEMANRINNIQNNNNEEEIEANNQDNRTKDL